MTFSYLEDTYPLSPMQQGMLFNSLYAPRSGVEIEQIVIDMPEALNVLAFKEAWQRVVAQHPVLRTRFRWEGLEQPLQDVYRQAQIPIEEEDWQGLSSDEQAQRLDRYLQNDRVRGFVLSEAPIMRVTLLRLGEAKYRCVWTFHHILLDGRSFPIVLQDLFTCYHAFCYGVSVKLKSPRPYRDHIEWLAAQDFGQAERYWRQTLKGFIAPTSFSVDKKVAKSPAIATEHGLQEVTLSSELTSALNSVAQACDVTLNTMLQSAWGLLLSRYSSEEDVVFGTVRAGRWNSVENADAMVGLFINTLPMRVRVKANLTVSEYLKTVRAQHVRLREPIREHSPLMKVQEWSDFPSKMPLFDSILAYERNTMNEMLQAATSDKWHFQLLEQVSFPLRVNVYGGYQDSPLQIKLGYEKPRFDEASIARMLGHFERLLEGMAANSEQLVSEVPILTKTEHHELLVDWNPAEVHAKHSAIHQLFEDRVEYSPDAIALSYRQEGSSITLTYRELNERANQLAHYLQAFGVERDVLVGLCVERTVEMVVGILAILKAGGAYVPLDPVSPPERLAFMLQDAQMPVLVTQERFLDKLYPVLQQAQKPHVEGSPKDNFKVICLDGPEQRVIQKQSTENALSHVTPDNLAYVIYTSGSTGKPKGVLVNHYNVVRLFEATDLWYGFNEKDVWTLFHSYAFDFSVWELWGALLYGGRLVVVPYEVSRSPDAFYELLVQEQVTVLNQTPSAFRQLIQAEESVGQAPNLALRYVIFGGEALELQSLRSWFERHGDQFPQLVNMYGITETTVHVTYRPITRNDLDKHGESSVIGVPIPDLQLYILDQNQQPVPIGVMGEMYVGGAGVTLGYLNRPELTEQRFIANPFHSPLLLLGAPKGHDKGQGVRAEARLYRSGDLARYLPNTQGAGSRDVEYLGRIDHQVKIRGFRIELGEIEATLTQHEAVQEVSVLAQDSPTGGKRLVAYVVVKQTPAPTVSEWRTYLKKTLPDYMVPSAFVVMEQFPLTNNGKLDRRALPQPENERPDLRSDYAPPRTHTERIIAEVWQTLLSVQKVGVYDNFFELGGDSLLAVRAVGALRKRINGEIEIYKLFESPTVRTLADALDAKQVQKASHITVDVRAKKRQAVIQRRKKVARRGRR